jgi:hypothetical protein
LAKISVSLDPIVLLAILSCANDVHPL